MPTKLSSETILRYSGVLLTSLCPRVFLLSAQAQLSGIFAVLRSQIPQVSPTIFCCLIHTWDLLLHFTPLPCEVVSKQIEVRGEFAAQILKLAVSAPEIREHLSMLALLSSAWPIPWWLQVNPAHTHQAGLELISFCSQQEELKSELLSGLEMSSV